MPSNVIHRVLTCTGVALLKLYIECYTPRGGGAKPFSSVGVNPHPPPFFGGSNLLFAKVGGG